MSKTFVFISLLILVIITPIITSNCYENDFSISPKKLEENKYNKRALYTYSDYSLNIILDLTYIKEGINKYNLTEYKTILLEPFNEVIQILNSLMKVKTRPCYTFYGYQFDDYGFFHWDKSRFGINYNKNYFRTCDYNMDLFVLARFMNSTELIKNKDDLITRKLLYLGKTSGQPIIGALHFNQNMILSYLQKRNSEEYFKYSILHQFIHILGFNSWVIKNYFPHYIIQEKDINGIERKYLKSTKVINVAKKYFNCSDINGIELEENDTSIHWRSNILLGEIMTKNNYQPEQILSEFTFAFLEDIGYYTVKYYTGGLMQFGRNKGCQFIKERCIRNNTIDIIYENEFHPFDNIKSSNDIYSSCSSARLSRTYSINLSINNYNYNNNKYFNSSLYNQYSYDDYYPIPNNLYDESQNEFYIGKCNEIGSDNYGSKIVYYNGTNYTNGYLQNITGEKYSNNSFCYQSSLYRNKEPYKDFLSKSVRAICYQTFCSSKSLTVKIHDVYIVCPRQGGKISADGFIGYFLCPDYYLICSGDVLCNDLFDCVNKKSEIKKESYSPDYEPKIINNINKVENDEIDDENNYELSYDGKCIKYCKQCNENKKCIICKNNYVLLGDKESGEIKCVPEEEISKGYYKDENTSIYYKCSEYCEKCSDEYNCLKCEESYTKLYNKNSSCYLINDLIPYYTQDPKDENNYINCAKIYNNCLTCNTTQCLSYNIIIFILQAIYNNNEINLFLVSEPRAKFLNNIILELIISTRKRLRNLEEKKIKIKLIKKNEGVNRIEKYSASIKDLNITDIINIEIKSINLEQNNSNFIYYINYPDNKNNLDISNVRELVSKGGTNFSKIQNNKNYKINFYKIVNINKGCKFDILIDSKFNNNKENISLNFIEIFNTSNIIKSNCSLSKNNNKINCILNKAIHSIFFFEDFIHYDDNELFAIIQDNKIISYNMLNKQNSFDIFRESFINPTLECSKDNFKDEDSKIVSLSNGIIICIIIGGIIILTSIILIFICVYKRYSKESKFKGKEPTDILGTEVGTSTTSINNKKKIILITTAGNVTELFADIKLTMEEIRKLYFKMIKKENLYLDKQIKFLYNGEVIPINSQEIVENLFFPDKDYIKITVTDVNRLIT